MTRKKKVSPVKLSMASFFSNTVQESLNNPAHGGNTILMCAVLCTALEFKAAENTRNILDAG